MAPSISNDVAPRDPATDPTCLEQSLRTANVAHPALIRLSRKLDHSRNSGVDSKPCNNRSYSRFSRELSCFSADTQVLLADRTTKAIELISVGDVVMSFDGSYPAPTYVSALESPLRDHLYILTFGDGSTLKLTQEHPLFTANGWKSLSPESTAEETPTLLVGKLEVGDHVLTAGGVYQTLTKVIFVPGEVRTYNIKKLSQHDSFYANGFLAHNKASASRIGARIPDEILREYVAGPTDLVRLKSGLFVSPPSGAASGCSQIL